MKIDAKKFLALTSLLAMPLVTASAGCIINADDEGTDTGNDSVGDSTGGSNSTTATTSTTAGTATSDTGVEESTGAGTSAGSGESAGTGADSGTAGESGSGGSESGGVDPEGCCVAHETPECSDPTVSECVCADPMYQVLCCDAIEGFWDETCINAVTELQCGKCP